MIKHISFNSLLLAFAIILLTSCKVNFSARDKIARELPASFISNGHTDSISIGSLSWREFFSDRALIQLIDTALEANLDLKISFERINRARATLRSSRGSLLPSIQLEGRAAVERFGDYTMNGVGNFDTNLSDNVPQDRQIPTPTPDYFVGASSQWEIDLWGKLRHAKNRDKFRLLESEYAKNILRTSLIYEVAAHYYELLTLDQELSVIRNNIALQTRAVEMMTFQKSAGRVTEAAVQQTRAQLLNTQGLEYDVLQRIFETENYINLLLGRFPRPIVRGTALTQQQLPIAAQPGLPYLMMTRRPDILEARANWFANASNVASARAAFYPTLTLSAYSGFHAFTSQFLFSTPASLAYGLGSGLTAPLFQRNEIRSYYQAAQAAEREAYFAYEKTVLQAFQEVANYVTRIDNLAASARLKEEEAEVLRNAVQNVNDMFRTGYASYLEVITAQKNLLDAELQLALLRRTQLQTFAGMYRASGGGL